MRDFVAALIAVLLLAVALSLVARLQTYHRRREGIRRAARELGQTIVAELPVEEELKLFSEGRSHFYCGEHVIPKNQIQAVRVLINGSPIAACISRRFPSAAMAPPTSFDDRSEGIVRDRWDVAIETTNGTTLVECGAIRERVSQQLARTIFEAVKKNLEV